MNSPWILVVSILALALLYILFPVALHTFQRYRHKKVLQCPENKQMVEVDVDAPLAAFSSAFGRATLRVKNCSLWPKRRGCEQGCVKE